MIPTISFHDLVIVFALGVVSGAIGAAWLMYKLTKAK